MFTCVNITECNKRTMKRTVLWAMEIAKLRSGYELPRDTDPMDTARRSTSWVRREGQMYRNIAESKVRYSYEHVRELDLALGGM